MINAPRLSTPAEFIASVETNIEFQALVEPASARTHVTRQQMQREYKPPKLCHNCESTDHWASACDKPKAACDICGKDAGHLTKYCFVSGDQPPPAWMSEQQKKTLLEKRSIYKMAKAASSSAKTNVMSATSIPASFSQFYPRETPDGVLF